MFTVRLVYIQFEHVIGRYVQIVNKSGFCSLFPVYQGRVIFDP